MGLKEVAAQNKAPLGLPLVRMKAAPVKTGGERLGNEFMNGDFLRVKGVPFERFGSNVFGVYRAPEVRVFAENEFTQKYATYLGQ